MVFNKNDGNNQSDEINRADATSTVHKYNKQDNNQTTDTHKGNNHTSTKHTTDGENLSLDSKQSNKELNNKSNDEHIELKAFDDRGPRKDFGDRGLRKDFGDRGPRKDFGDRGPRKDFGDRGPRRDFGDRGPRRDFGDRGPRRDFGDRPGGDRGPRRDFRDRPGGDRGPRRDFGDRPGGDRGPRRDFSDRASGDRGPRKDFGDRGPRRDFGDRPGGDRPRFGGGDRTGGDRGPRKDFGDRGPRRDFGDRPRFGGGDRPGGDRPRFSGGDRPRFDKPAGDRPNNDRRSKDNFDRGQKNFDKKDGYGFKGNKVKNDRGNGRYGSDIQGAKQNENKGSSKSDDSRPSKIIMEQSNIYRVGNVQHHSDIQIYNTPERKRVMHNNTPTLSQRAQDNNSNGYLMNKSHDNNSNRRPTNRSHDNKNKSNNSHRLNNNNSNNRSMTGSNKPTLSIDSFNIPAHYNDLLFIPIGGCNEIGINFNAYHYKGKWLLVDCGSGFVDNEMLGVEMKVANIDFIQQYKKDFIGLVLTHAHEDHVGGIVHLSKFLGCPIYATKFTASFVSLKLTEAGLNDEIRIIKSDTKLFLDPFELEFIELNHSAPEMQAILIRTTAGNVLHTGDWKIDHDPVLGEPFNHQKLQAIGDEGVLAMVCDSTNALTTGSSGSEGDVGKALMKFVAQARQLVVVTSFASNVARLMSIIKAARENGRIVALAGRSLHRIIATARDSGYDIPEDWFIKETEVSDYPRKKVLVIATGCQGEKLAAMSKMAAGKHNITLHNGDTIIFSSKVIPGNEKKVFNIYNELTKKQLHIITDKDDLVHVSGHPCIDELHLIYDLVRPIISVPVHGEAMHLLAHTKLAKSWGVPHAFEMRNGLVLHMHHSAPSIVGEVPSGYIGIDGKRLIPQESEIFFTREKIANGGLLIVTLVYDQNNNLTHEPKVKNIGCLTRFEHHILSEIQDIVSDNKHLFCGLHTLDVRKMQKALLDLLHGYMKNVSSNIPLISLEILK